MPNKKETYYKNGDLKKDCKNHSHSSSSSSYTEINSKNLFEVEIYKFNLSLLNEPLMAIIKNHYNTVPENLEVEDNKGNGISLFLDISYCVYNNFRHYKQIMVKFEIDQTD